MALKFHDIDAVEERKQSAGSIIQTGTILFSEDDSWLATRPGTGFAKQGKGVLRDLEPGFWICNLEFDRTCLMGKGLKGNYLKSDSYLRFTMEQLQAEWGLAQQQDFKILEFTSKICNRVMRLTQEMLEGNLGEMGYSDISEIRGHIQKAPTLATGIAEVNAGALAMSSTDDKRILEHFQKTLMQGLFITGRKSEEHDDIVLNFHFPRLSYAKAISSPTIPAKGAWQVATRTDGMSVSQFFAEIRKTGRPAIYRAQCKAKSGHIPEFIQASISARGGDGSETYRSHYLEEEILALNPYCHIQIESAICGSGWMPSATSKLLGALERVAGGPGAANASWSVGMVAENILVSAFRKVRKQDAWRNAEAIWIAGRDRVSMLSAIAKLYDVGAMLVNATGGTITVRCPKDPELLLLVLNTAWDTGLVLSMDCVSKLKVEGAEIPSEAAHFGGNHVDYLLSSFAHRHARGAIWKLDEIQDLDTAVRERTFRSLTGVEK